MCYSPVGILERQLIKKFDCWGFGFSASAAFMQWVSPASRIARWQDPRLGRSKDTSSDRDGTQYGENVRTEWLPGSIDRSPARPMMRPMTREMLLARVWLRFPGNPMSACSGTVGIASLAGFGG